MVLLPGMNVLPEGRIPFRGASTWYRTPASIPQLHLEETDRYLEIVGDFLVLVEARQEAA